MSISSLLNAAVEPAGQAGAEDPAALAALRLFREIFENSSDAISVIDSDGRFVLQNRAHLDLLGFEDAELVRLGPVAYMEEADFAVALENTRSSGRHRGEMVCRRRDGRGLFVEMSTFTIRDGAGQPLYYVAIKRDVTRRRVQYEVAGIIADARTVAEAAQRIIEVICRGLGWDVGALWLNESDLLRGHALWISPGLQVPEFERLTRELTLGCGTGLPGTVWQRMEPTWVADVLREENFPRRHGAAEAGLHAGLGVPVTAADRLLGVLEFFSTAIRPPDADLLNLLRTVSSQLGQFIVRRSAEAELQRQKEAAEAANAAKDRFLAVLSHELRTPLTPVLAELSALETDPALGADLRRSMKLMARHIELEARLIDDLLDLTRIGQGKLELQRHPLDVHQAVERALEICRGEVEARSLELEVDLAAERSWVLGDEIRLQQVFWNLVKNAAKFTPAGGRVQVSSRNEPMGEVLLEVTDSGCGIRPDELERIFLPFEQGEARKIGRLGGLGLGLPISLALVRAHGGDLWAESGGSGQGAVFRVRLTTVAADRPGGGRSMEPSAAQEAVNCRLLLVDDHGETLEVLERAFRRRGYSITVARSLGEALAAAQHEHFDVLISDIGLPDGTGMDLMRLLNGRQRLAGIALSGFGMEADLQQSREAGFSEHLVKPVSFPRLEALVRQLAGEQAAGTQPARPQDG